VSKQFVLLKNVHQDNSLIKKLLPQAMMVAKNVAQDFGLDLDRRLAVILSLAPQANNLPTQQQLQPQMDAQTVVLVSGPEQGLRQVVLIKSAPLDNTRL